MMTESQQSFKNKQNGWRGHVAAFRQNRPARRERVGRQFQAGFYCIENSRTTRMNDPRCDTRGFEVETCKPAVKPVGQAGFDYFRNLSGKMHVKSIVADLPH